MLPTIKLYNQISLWTVKIYYEMTYRLLSKELIAL